MFFVSAVKEKFLKRNKKTIIWVLSVVLVLYALLWVVYGVLHIPSRAFCEGVGEYSLLADTESQREEFFLPFGYKAHTLDCYEITVPSTGKVYEEYNEIQKSQGLDLTAYGGESAQLYIFSLDGSKEGSLYGFMIVYRGTVIGAHVSDCLYPAAVRGLRE